MPKKKESISYGRGQVPKFTSAEALARYLDKKAKAQAKEKAEKEGKK